MPSCAAAVAKISLRTQSSRLPTGAGRAAKARFTSRGSGGAVTAVSFDRHGVALAKARTTLISSDHPQCLHIRLENRLGLGALVRVLLAHAHDGAQRLDVVAVALGLGEDVADVVGDRLLFFLQPLDALDDGLELVLGKFRRGLVVADGGGGGHLGTPNGTGKTR